MRTVKYVIDTEHLCLLLQPKLNEDVFYLEGISDSEYAGDPDTRISVSCDVLYFCGAPIAWKLPTQHLRLLRKYFYKEPTRRNWNPISVSNQHQM
jgi:hypothetical protein